MAAVPFSCKQRSSQSMKVTDYIVNRSCTVWFFLATERSKNAIYWHENVVDLCLKQKYKYTKVC